jgi:uncharacterized protein (DUF488 family)
VGRVLTIGHGGRTIEQFIDLLRREHVQFLLDVRSSPYSRFQPEFSQGALKAALEARGVRYIFVGDSLGGRPSDGSVYRDGHVDYGLCRTKPWFLQGIARIEASQQGGHVVALMCSEGKPESCHRSKLIGVELLARGIRPEHIDTDERIVDQETVMLRLSGGQRLLWAEEPQLSRFRRKTDAAEE